MLFNVITDNVIIRLVWSLFSSAPKPVWHFYNQSTEESVRIMLSFSYLMLPVYLGPKVIHCIRWLINCYNNWPNSNCHYVTSINIETWAEIFFGGAAVAFVVLVALVLVREKPEGLGAIKCCNKISNSARDMNKINSN